MIAAISEPVQIAIIAGLFALAQTWMNRRINNKLDVIHDLSNSQMGAQKRLLRDSTALRAHATNLAVDIEAAFAAEKDYEEHERRQRVADATKSRQ